MKIILRQDYEGLGNAGDILEVKSGYARNFLIPKGIAYPAEKSFLKMFEEEKKQKQFKLNKEKKIAEEEAKKLESVSVTIPVAVGEGDKLYGSVTAQTIFEHLEKQGVTIDKKAIVLDEPIKALGVYSVPVKLHKDVSVDIKVWVVKE
ncbi:MAG: 50S ribosomal protein L9 [Calditrichia bacterium]